MEIRAPYVLIGGFVLAVIAAAFGFVYWLHNTGEPDRSGRPTAFTSKIRCQAC